MKGTRAILGIAGLVSLVGGAIWLSSNVDGITDPTEPVAAAIVADFAEIAEINNEIAESEGAPVSFIPLCIESAVSLDFARLTDLLSSAHIRPIPVSDCTSRTIEGDFGMFTSITDWFAENGQPAGMREVVAVQCSTIWHCTVDIDSHGSGMRFDVERSGGSWTVNKRTRRWVV